jgi:hypothetical protein
MRFYDAQLTSAERRALKKHTHDLQDEIDLARTLITRELGETADIEAICKAMETITKMALARRRLVAQAIDRAVERGILTPAEAKSWLYHASQQPLPDV